MSIYLIVLTAIALSMDAFAVSISCGISNAAKSKKDQLILATTFALFQGIMPIIGYYLSNIFKIRIENLTSYIAFAILILIGIHMILEAIKITENCDLIELTPKKIILLAFATSIDAFATGISFSMINVSIFYAAIIIAFVTFVISFMGIKFGCKISKLFRKGSEVFGGLIIIVIGLKILIDSL